MPCRRETTSTSPTRATARCSTPTQRQRHTQRQCLNSHHMQRGVERARWREAETSTGFHTHTQHTHTHTPQSVLGVFDQPMFALGTACLWWHSLIHANAGFWNTIASSCSFVSETKQRSFEDRITSHHITHTGTHKHTHKHNITTPE